MIEIKCPIKKKDKDKQNPIYSPNIPILILGMCKPKNWNIVVNNPRAARNTDQSFEPILDSENMGEVN